MLGFRGLGVWGLGLRVWDVRFSGLGWAYCFGGYFGFRRRKNDA